MKEPKSMEECLYYTNRTIGNGSVRAWVFRKDCPKCKAPMGLPMKATGKPDKKSPFFVCADCGYREEKKEHEESLHLDIVYTCPECGHSAETSIPYKRKKFQGVDAYVFECGKCKAKIPITKKLKTLKGK